MMIIPMGRSIKGLFQPPHEAEIRRHLPHQAFHLSFLMQEHFAILPLL